MLFFETAAAAAWIAVFTLAVLDAALLPRLRDANWVDDEDVTLIVPARNEARNIGAWIACARSQRVRPLRIIVADDGSRDVTWDRALAACGADGRITLLRCPAPPIGWVGKSWAAYCAARLARSRWLFFSDADVRMDPGALSSALEAAHRLGADALSATPTLVCSTWWERQVMPVVAMLIFSAMPGFATNDDRLPSALMAGGFMLISARAYWLVGGHAAVRSSIAEDRDLAERLKAFGFRVRMTDGSRVMRVRMYSGFADLWQGWRKNFFEGVRRNLWGAAAAVLGAAAMLVVPLPALLWLAVRRRWLAPRDRAWLLLTCSACVASTPGVRALRDRAVGVRTSLTSLACTPVAGLFVAAVMVSSAWRIVSGRGQAWKDRIIH